jgi:pimeloyl-ACP methyl ester carboxylesterase
MRDYKLAVTPDNPFQTDMIEIRLSGFAPCQPVRVKLSTTDLLDTEWESSGHYLADSKGMLCLSDAPSRGGTYRGIDGNGIFWSMGTKSGQTPSFPQPVFQPLSAIGYDLIVEVGGETCLTQKLELRRLADGLAVQLLDDSDLRGTALRWKDRTRSRGAILCLAGSGGGVDMMNAPVLASLGYDVLCLAYFAHEDLPNVLERIPLEYFARGFEWMRVNFGFKRFAVHGTSRGGELALILASSYPEQVCGTLAAVPMHVPTPAFDPMKEISGTSWTFEGRDVPSSPNISMSLEEMRREAEASDLGFAATPHYQTVLECPETERLAIPVERAAGPVLLLSGADDQVWPSAWGGDRVIDKLRCAEFPHFHRHLSFRDAGHWIPLPNSPTTYCSSAYHSLADIRLALGGSAQGAAVAAPLAWMETKGHYERVFA